uniref:Ion transport domain-containing protein n=1 Tax=Solanum lycopersicum TaxID=4081 RepID=A0A3Q7GI34_SOLLC
TFLVVLVVYTSWVCPFEFGFIGKPVEPLAKRDKLVNGFFFAIDIILTFFVAFLDRTTYLLVDEHKKIAWKYMSTWFLFDVISTIPSELAVKISPKPLWMRPKARDPMTNHPVLVECGTRLANVEAKIIGHHEFSLRRECEED